MHGPVYHAGWPPDFVANWEPLECWQPGEHLHYRCDCGYETSRPTKDAKAVAL
jgi:hypothetical protein